MFTTDRIVRQFIAIMATEITIRVTDTITRAIETIRIGDIGGRWQDTGGGDIITAINGTDITGTIEIEAVRKSSLF